jgi:hypothetical protein
MISDSIGENFLVSRAFSEPQPSRFKIPNAINGFIQKTALLAPFCG